MLGSHTEWAALQNFPYSANAGQSGQNHDRQTHEANQSTNVKNLRQPAKLSPFCDHRYTSFPKHLKLMPTLRTSLLINFNRRDSE